MVVEIILIVLIFTFFVTPKVIKKVKKKFTSVRTLKDFHPLNKSNKK